MAVMFIRALVLILSIPIVVQALRCHLHHDFQEDGKRMRILPDICSSEKYCISATYRDPNPRKKNGFSSGCDRVDCAEIETGMNSAWRKRHDNMTCRPHRDYGYSGMICCCSTDLCNSVVGYNHNCFYNLASFIIISLLCNYVI